MPGVYPRQLFGEKAEKSNISSRFLPALLVYELFPRAGSAGLLPKDSCWFSPARRIGGEGPWSPSLRDHGRSLKEAPSDKNKRPQPESGGHRPSARLPGSTAGLLLALALSPKSVRLGVGLGAGTRLGEARRGAVFGKTPQHRAPRPIPRGPCRKVRAPLAQPLSETSPARKPGKPGKVEGQRAARRPSAPRTAPNARRPPPLPVVVLEGRVSQQQVPEAVPRRQGQHLRVQVAHLEAASVRALAVPAAAVPAARLPTGTRQRPLSPRPRGARAPPTPGSASRRPPPAGSAEPSAVCTPKYPHPHLPHASPRGVSRKAAPAHIAPSTPSTRSRSASCSPNLPT